MLLLAKPVRPVVRPHRLLLLGFTFTILAASRTTAAQTVKTVQPDSARRRVATCANALHEYQNVRDVPAPYDTIKLRVAPTTVDLQDERDIKAFMMDVFARAGATGYITRPPVGADGLFSFVPVFVPADSARVASECAKRS